MNAKDFLKSNNHTIDAIQCYDQNLTSGGMDIVKLMEEYHQAKLKLLDIDFVSKRFTNKIDKLTKLTKIEGFGTEKELHKAMDDINILNKAEALLKI
jgi:hypothetical protein